MAGTYSSIVRTSLGESAVSVWGLALSGRTPDSVSQWKKDVSTTESPDQNYF